MISLFVLIIFVILSIILVPGVIVGVYAGVMHERYPELNILGMDLTKAIIGAVCAICLYAFTFAYCSEWIGDILSNLLILASVGASAVIGAIVCFIVHHQTSDERNYILLGDKIEELEQNIENAKQNLGEATCKVRMTCGEERDRYIAKANQAEELLKTYNNVVAELDSQRLSLEAKISGDDLKRLSLTSHKNSMAKLNYSLDRMNTMNEMDNNISSVDKIKNKYS